MGKTTSEAPQYCTSEEEAITQWMLRKDVMRRNLPNGAEATMVMVGDIDILRKPIFVFVRLAESTFMFNVTEVCCRKQKISEKKDRFYNGKCVFFYRFQFLQDFLLFFLFQLMQRWIFLRLEGHLVLLCPTR